MRRSWSPWGTARAACGPHVGRPSVRPDRAARRAAEPRARTPGAARRRTVRRPAAGGRRSDVRGSRPARRGRHRSPARRRRWGRQPPAPCRGRVSWPGRRRRAGRRPPARRDGPARARPVCWLGRRGARLARGERQKPLPTHPAGPDLPGGSALDVPCPPPCRPVEREQGDEGSRTTAPRARTATTSRPRPRTRRFCWSATWTPRQHVRRRPARSGPPRSRPRREAATRSAAANTTAAVGGRHRPDRPRPHSPGDRPRPSPPIQRPRRRGEAARAGPANRFAHPPRRAHRPAWRGVRPGRRLTPRRTGACGTSGWP